MCVCVIEMILTPIYMCVSLYVDIYSTNFCIYVMYTVLMYICVCNKYSTNSLYMLYL